MGQFLDNAQQIFNVARADSSGDYSDFALLIYPDGGLHMIMETPFALESAVAASGASTGYRVTRSGGAVRVTGKSGGQTCILEEARAKSFQKSVLGDCALYSITSPLSISAGSAR